MKPIINYVQAQEALQLIKSNMRVFVHGSAQTPLHLLSELGKRKNELRCV